MPDIAMCNSETCPRRQECYRHEAVPSPMLQAYGFFDEEDCEHFWPTKLAIDNINMEN